MAHRSFSDELIEHLALRDELHRLGARTSSAPLSRIATAIFQAGALTAFRDGDRAQLWSIVDELP
ncbi:MAG TPA: hypothetical protein VL463_11395 [Kofleriaceae bacterium]|jgi:hypothetical protein|nr:hypothetical protein [Kofleriaceae bacterium]